MSENLTGNTAEETAEASNVVQFAGKPRPKSDNNGPRAKQIKITEMVFVCAIFVAALTMTMSTGYFGLIFLGAISFPIVLIIGLEGNEAFEEIPQTDLILMTLLKVIILTFSILLYVRTTNPWTLFSILGLFIPYTWHMAKSGADLIN